MKINRQIADLKRANYRELPVNRKRFLNPFLLMSTTEALNRIAEGPPKPILPIKYPPRIGLDPTAVVPYEKPKVKSEKPKVLKGIPVGEAVLGNLKPTAIARPVKDAIGAMGNLLPPDPLTAMANKNLSELSKDPYFKAGGGKREGIQFPIDDTDTKGLAPLKTVAESENIDTQHDVSSRTQGSNDPAVIPSISLPGTVGNQANLDQVFGAGFEGKTSEVQDLRPQDLGDESAIPDIEAEREVVRQATDILRKKEAQTRRRKEGQQRRRKREAEDKLKEARAGIPGGNKRPKPDSTSTGRDALPTSGGQRVISEGIQSAQSPPKPKVGETVKDGDRLYTQTRRRRR